MITRLIRVLFGFLMACLVAALVKVLFAYSPAELSGMSPDRASDVLALTWPIATHMAIFSAPFALIAIALGEWQRWGDWTYYVVAGVLIALIGFIAQYNSETAAQGWSVTASNYPLVAFLTCGAIGGLAYWIFSGHVVAEPAQRVATPPHAATPASPPKKA
jgi:hypothetical protein